MSEMEPKDATRFEEIVTVKMTMPHLVSCIMAQNVSPRIKLARMRAVRRDAEVRLAELQALFGKYEDTEPFLHVLDGMITKLREKIAKKG
jgi:hypothetical protein